MSRCVTLGVIVACVTWVGRVHAETYKFTEVSKFARDIAPGADGTVWYTGGRAAKGGHEIYYVHPKSLKSTLVGGGAVSLAGSFGGNGAGSIQAINDRLEVFSYTPKGWEVFNHQIRNSDDGYQNTKSTDPGPTENKGKGSRRTSERGDCCYKMFPFLARETAITWGNNRRTFAIGQTPTHGGFGLLRIDWRGDLMRADPATEDLFVGPTPTAGFVATPIPGGGVHLAVVGSHAGPTRPVLWVVNDIGDIYTSTVPEVMRSFDKWPPWNRMPGTAADVAAGVDGSVWMVGHGKTQPGVFKWDAVRATWIKIADEVGARIVVMADGQPCILTPAARVSCRVRYD